MANTFAVDRTVHRAVCACRCAAVARAGGKGDLQLLPDPRNDMMIGKWSKALKVPLINQVHSDQHWAWAAAKYALTNASSRLSGCSGGSKKNRDNGRVRLWAFNYLEPDLSSQPGSRCGNEFRRYLKAGGALLKIAYDRVAA